MIIGVAPAKQGGCRLFFHTWFQSRIHLVLLPRYLQQTNNEANEPYAGVVAVCGRMVLCFSMCAIPPSLAGPWPTNAVLGEDVDEV